MKTHEPVPGWVAPIFILADDDQEAVNRILESIHQEWTYIPVANPRNVVRYSKELSVTAVFLAAHMAFPRGGAAALLQNLLDEVGKPVVIMAEEWSPETAERWRRMGAADCIPHPTRQDARMEGLRAKLQDLALAREAERRRGVGQNAESKEQRP